MVASARLADEESPNSTGPECWVTPRQGNLTDSVAENKPLVSHVQ